MANAKICDRCGKVFSRPEDQFRYHVFDTEFDDPVTYGGVRIGHMMDLCASCCQSLKFWAQSPKMEAKNGA